MKNKKINTQLDALPKKSLDFFTGNNATLFTKQYENIRSIIKGINTELQKLHSILNEIDKLKELRKKIDELITKKNNIKYYKTDPKTEKTIRDTAKEIQEKATIQKEIDKLEKEYKEKKEKLIEEANSISNNESLLSGSGNITTKKGELSYADAEALAEKLDVPVKYILSLHLHEGYKLGDSLLPDGITPDVIHYAGEHGYPILIDGFDNMVEERGDRYRVTAKTSASYFIKESKNYATISPGREYNITWQPITFEEMEGRNVYWTWYGPISQGRVLGRDAAPIQCTQTQLYPCDDQLYRDKDGYIVIAGSPYKNQFFSDGKTVNFDAHGGLPEEDLYVLTPFGIGKFYDNGSAQVAGGIESDIYRNDGYEGNTIASTEYGQRLRESAVEQYETLDLNWRDLIH